MQSGVADVGLPGSVVSSVQIDWRQQRVLVIAAHPDDEAIGCDGLISRVKREGGQVHMLHVAIDDLVEYSPAGGSTARQRWAEIEQVAEFLSLDGWHAARIGERRTLRLDALPRAELVDLLEGRPEHGVALPVLRPTVVVAPEVTYVSLGRRLRYPTAICATISRGIE
ncbi:PIG-L family deacetylase [Nocardia sp. NPDC002869]|uniref:PIG-L family deacetylase n=1 Tax=Nocardia sp. NPDC002869 TaxID=3161032 RepID=UPI00398CD167